jgi:hypothetical protein
MPIAEDAAALHAHAALEEVDASATLVAVGRYLGASEEFEFGHR